jgi:hypothetical protein
VGNTRHRSWSFSRQRLFQTCKRAFFFQYYWKSEPNQDVLWELRRVKTIPLLVGDLVHESISLALRQWVHSHVEAKNLFSVANTQYESAMKASLRSAVAMRNGKRPPGKWPILAHHLNTGERSAIEEIGLETLRDYLAIFEASDAWAFLMRKKTHIQLWEPITTNSDTKPSFVATAALGFGMAAGLRIYTPFDLALANQGHFILVDWKAGKKTDQALAQVRKQLTSYCLWALDQKKARRMDLRVQPYFLQDGEKWAPSTVSREEFFDVVHEIEDHLTAEMQLVTVNANADGEPIGFAARVEDFPPAPRESICATCKFLTACEEGRRAVERA